MSSSFDRFNVPARRAMLLAFREAKRCQHDFLGTEHVLFGLLCDSAGPAALLLRALGTAPEAILGQVQSLMLDDETTAALEKFPLSPAVRRAFEHAYDETRKLGRLLVGPEHLLLGLLHEEACEAALILTGAGVTLTTARQRQRLMSPAEMPGHQVQSEPTSAVEPEAAAAALDTLVASQPIVYQAASTRSRRARIAAEAPPTPAEIARRGRAVEMQLWLTQLMLGGVLGFFLGYLIDEPGRAIVFVMGGVVLAMLRSSLAGAVVGLIAAVSAMAALGLDFEERWHSGRLLFALLAMFGGSMLGNFWGRTLARLTEPSAAVEDAKAIESRE
jgi:uncharacterized membrane protein (Fun14 family)